MRDARTAFLLLRPPGGQQHVVIRLRGGGPKSLKICAKTHFWKNSRCVAGPGFCSKLIQIEAPLLLVPPFRPPIRRDSPPGKGGPTSQNLCQNLLFEQISMYCWPRIFVKIDPNRSLFTSGCLAGAPVWPEFHRSGLLGCMTAAEL